MQHREPRGNLPAPHVNRPLFLALSTALCLFTALEVRADAWSEILVEPRAELLLSSPEISDRMRGVRLLARYGDPRSATRILASRVSRTAFPEERLAMIRALSQLGRTEAVAALVEARSRVNDPELLFALAAFASDDAVRELVAALADPPAAASARQALLRVGSRAVPRLLRALRDPLIARSAMDVLGAIGDRRATWPLVGFLDSSNPRDRESAVLALTRLRDDRAAPALLQHREDSDSAVRRLILVSLGELGIRDARPLFEHAVRGDDSEMAVVALTAWMKSDPTTARVECLRLLGAADSPLQPLARTLMIENPDVAFVDALARATETEASHADAAFALARVPGAGGLDALLHLLDAHASEALYLATAVAVRGAGDACSGADRTRATQALIRHRNDVPTMVSLVARAVAFDSSVGRHLEHELQSSDPSRRALAAQGLEYLGDRAFAGVVASRLLDERDAEAFRREASALLQLNGSVTIDAVGSRLFDDATGPEALLVLAHNLEKTNDRDRRRIRARMRAALRSPTGRVRAAAARALAIAADVDAWGALVNCLEDRESNVRVACARALLTLPISDNARLAVRGLARTESDEDVYAVLHEVADGVQLSRHDIRAVGTRVLVTRLVDNNVSSLHRTIVSVSFADGRELLLEPLPDGFVVVPDLVSGSAAVSRALATTGAP